jgi:hypothetical protein
MPLKREEQIRQALQQLKPATDKRDGCRADIENALDEVEKWTRVDTVCEAEGSKRANEIRRGAYNSALRKLREADKKIRAVGAVGPFSYAQIDRAIRWSEGSRRVPPALFRRRRAVARAYGLVMKWGGGPEIATTKRKIWWHLARILYGKQEGEPGADLYRQIFAFKSKYAQEQKSPLSRI